MKQRDIRWYALKVNTLVENSEAALKYYRLEEAIGESFRHKNIVSYMRAREVHTFPQKTSVILMEYCERGDLRKRRCIRCYFGVMTWSNL